MSDVETETQPGRVRSRARTQLCALDPSRGNRGHVRSDTFRAGSHKGTAPQRCSCPENKHLVRVKQHTQRISRHLDIRAQKTPQIHTFELCIPSGVDFLQTVPSPKLRTFRAAMGIWHAEREVGRSHCCRICALFA